MKDTFLQNFENYKNSMTEIGGYNFANKLILISGIY